MSGSRSKGLVFRASFTPPSMPPWMLHGPSEDWETLFMASLEVTTAMGR